MKTKVKNSFRKGPRLVTVRLTGRERLNYLQARWLTSGPSDFLLPFLYSEERSTRLDYDVYGTQPLTKYAQSSMTTTALAHLLGALCDVVYLCVEQGVSTAQVWFAPDDVYMTPEGVPQLVLVPATKLQERRGTPLELLEWLGDPAHVHLSVGQDNRHLASLNDWARGSEVFSPERFAGFLASEFPNEEGLTVVRAAAAILPGEETGQLDDAASDDFAYPGSVLDPLELLGVDRDAEDSSLGAMGTSDMESPRIVRERDGLSYALGEGDQAIGRSEACELTFGGNGNVSRRHALLHVALDGTVLLEDLGAANGTSAQGRRLDPRESVELRRGDRFALADEWFRMI